LKKKRNFENQVGDRKLKLGQVLKTGYGVWSKWNCARFVSKEEFLSIKVLTSDDDFRGKGKGKIAPVHTTKACEEVVLELYQFLI
jgi:hypothetical protein